MPEVTVFTDMNSGGGQKLGFAHGYVKRAETDAIAWFKERFQRDPENVTCDCCGPDYAITELDSMIELEQIYPEAVNLELL